MFLRVISFRIVFKDQLRYFIDDEILISLENIFLLEYFLLLTSLATI